MRFALRLAPIRAARWLAWVFAASLVLPLTFFGLVAHQSRIATLAAAEHQMVGTVSLLREHAEKVLDTDELVAQQVDQLIAGQSWEAIAGSETLHQELKQLDRHLPQFGGIFVVAPDGIIANSSRPLAATPVNVSDRDYFSALRDGHRDAFISRVYRDRATNGEQFDFARRRSSLDGRFNGIINILDRPLYFQEEYRTIANSASVVLVGDDGEELASYPAPMFSGSRAPAGLIASLPEKEPLLVGTVPSPRDGADRVGIYQRIQGYPLFVGYSLPRGVIMASWRETVVLNGSLICIGSLTVAFMAWLVLRGVRSESAEIQRREEAEAKMEQARRMEIIGQLTAGVAHDFNNLLTVISVNIERLRANASGNSRKQVEAALSATSRGTGLIRQMLTFASRQAREQEIVDINEVLAAFVQLLGSALTKAITVDYQLTTKSTICHIDRTEFELAVLNIATNSRHAMPHGGRLEVDTELVAVHNDDDGLVLTPGNYVRIAFIDSGGGMPPDVLARAFEPFFTTRKRGTGTGLGLSQVSGFAKHSGGVATVASVVGRGTTITIYLPMVEAGAVSTAVLATPDTS
jgi:two-component system NtrC family sensor kinase